MLILSSTSDIVRAVTSAAGTIDVHASWVDNSSGTITPGRTNTDITTAATTTVVGSPGASTQRTVKTLSIHNSHASTSNTITVEHSDGTTVATLMVVTLAPNETLVYTDSDDWQVRNKNGQIKKEDTTQVGYTGIPLDYYKIGTASEAVGVRYCLQKDTGMPGAYSLGAPGANGWWVDSSTANNAANPAGVAQVGAHRLENPSSGNYYMTNIGMTSSVAHLIEVWDIIWYNTGIVVTTTTAQTITMPATSKPSRDMYGTTNGDGWIPAILVTGATTNAGAVTNTTLSYTDSDGNAGNTATIASFPATAVIGTLVPFQLAAGDRGVRSIESITLGTSYGGGSISVVLLRKLATVPNPVINVGGIMNKLTSDPTGVKLYNGTALLLSYISSATTATTVSGVITVVTR